MILHRKAGEDADKEKTRIAAEYRALTEKLEQIRSKFDYAMEDDDIDALIYEENAVLSRLASLHKRAKAKGISVQIYEYNKAQQ